jgi:NADPH-dependent 2,4-dienoyl-CoA reductase/sulfur reductase-like enzyme
MHEARGVNFHMGQKADRILGEGSVSSVLLQDGEELPAFLVLYAFGVEPVVDFLEETDLLEDGAVVVDETLRTRAAHVYAAGDIASVPFAGGHRQRVEHWVEAQRQGRHAALSMLGGGEPYRSFPFFWTRQYDTSLKFIGVPSAMESIAYRGGVEDGSFVAGFYMHKHKLMGVAGIQANRELLAAEGVLRRGEDIPFKEFSESSLWEK